MTLQSKTDEKIVNGYFHLTDNLSVNNKLDLISKLTLSLKINDKNSNNTFKESFGELLTNETAEELINSIRASRTSTRKIESF